MEERTVGSFAEAACSDGLFGGESASLRAPVSAWISNVLWNLSEFNPGP
jgi:hypothetical protein